VRINLAEPKVDESYKELAEYAEKLPAQVYDPTSSHVCCVVGESAFLLHLLRFSPWVFFFSFQQEELFQSVPERAESCAWFNRFIVRILMEYRASNFEEKWCVGRLRFFRNFFFFFFRFGMTSFVRVRRRQRMNRRLAEIVDKPSFVGDIVMESVDLTNQMPVIQPIQLLKAKAPYEIRAECDVVYNGGATCTVRTSVFGLSVSMTVALDHLSGRVLFICPSGPDPICTISFRQQPYTKFSVVPAVASRRIRHLPAVSGYIVQALTRIVATDTVLPNGVCFHIPLKSTMTTSGRNMDLSTIRKVRTRLQKEALERLEKTQREAHAENAAAHQAMQEFEPIVHANGGNDHHAAPVAHSKSAPAAVSSSSSTSAAAGAATPAAGTAAAAAAAQQQQQAHGGGWGVGALLGAVGTRVKEARQRQLARAQAELEKEREKRQKLAEDRKERERLREVARQAAKAARQQSLAPSSIDPHHAVGVAAGAAAVSTAALAVSDDESDDASLGADEPFDGEKHAELARDAEPLKKADSLPEGRTFSDMVDKQREHAPVAAAARAAAFYAAHAAAPDDEPVIGSLASSSQHVITPVDIPPRSASAEAVLPHHPDAAAAKALTPRSASLDRLVISTTTHNKPDEAPVVDAASAEVLPVPPPKRKHADSVDKQAEAAAVHVNSTVATVVPAMAEVSSKPIVVEAPPKALSPEPTTHVVPPTSLSPAPVQQHSPTVPPKSLSPAPTVVPPKSLSPAPAHDSSTMPPKSLSPAPAPTTVPPKSVSPAPSSDAAPPVVPPKSAPHAPAHKSDVEPVVPPKPAAKPDAKAAPALPAKAEPKHEPPPAVPPKHADAHAHKLEPAPALPPKHDNAAKAANRKSLELNRAAVDSALGKAGDRRSADLTKQAGEFVVVAAAATAAAPIVDKPLPTKPTEPLALSPTVSSSPPDSPPTLSPPAIEVEPAFETPLSPRNNEHGGILSDNESDLDGPLSFEFGSTTQEVLGSGTEDIDLLADSIFGDTPAPRSAPTVGLFPGISGTASLSHAHTSTSPPRTGMVGKASGFATRLIKSGKTVVKKTIDYSDLDDLFGPSHPGNSINSSNSNNNNNNNSNGNASRARANATASAGTTTPSKNGSAAPAVARRMWTTFLERTWWETRSRRPSAATPTGGKQSKLKALLTRRKPTAAETNNK
jgi:hypothetical protein